MSCCFVIPLQSNSAFWSGGAGGRLERAALAAGAVSRRQVGVASRGESEGGGGALEGRGSWRLAARCVALRGAAADR